ncbi:MurR/RpiR family transcriptional regulator [Microbispora sp. H13382]|uniref:MurR/RpiR family transcriptional regulator n=1 Tax=Microbispora sp. H13382 TaxID=2729112 RepID=UPI002175F4DD|nr:MurR/RpiR family transcriptional regulator [Microbispora sp. H13382]
MKACRPTGPAWAGEAGEMNTGHNADDGPGGHLGNLGGRDVPGDRDVLDVVDVFGDFGDVDGEAASRLLRLFEGHRLTPVQRRIAHCLARHAAEAPFLSSVEVAELAGVSQPSVTRFAIALGYSGYPGLRRRFRELGVPPGRGRDGAGRNGKDAGPDAGSSAPAVAPRLPGGGGDGQAPEDHGPGLDSATGPGGEYRRAVLAEIENLRALARSLDDPGPVAEAARLLAASRPLPVLGLRAAAAQAAGFAYFAAKIHPDVRPLHEAGSLLADRVEQAAAAGATALLCFALPRYPAELVDALRAARAAGLNVVTVADRRVPSLAGLSHVLLTAAVGTRLVFDTACAPMMLGRVLLEAMCDELPGAQARLEAFEASAAARGVFLID